MILQLDISICFSIKPIKIFTYLVKNTHLNIKLYRKQGICNLLQIKRNIQMSTQVNHL